MNEHDNNMMDLLIYAFSHVLPPADGGWQCMLLLQPRATRREYWLNWRATQKQRGFEALFTVWHCLGPWYSWNFKVRLPIPTWKELEALGLGWDLDKSDGLEQTCAQYVGAHVCVILYFDYSLYFIILFVHWHSIEVFVARQHAEAFQAARTAASEFEKIESRLCRTAPESPSVHLRDS